MLTFKSDIRYKKKRGNYIHYNMYYLNLKYCLDSVHVYNVKLPAYELSSFLYLRLQSTKLI